MANTEFKIQSDTVSLNGVPLSSSVDGKVVIPGVTRSTGYRVEEVEDTDDQTYNSFPAGTEGAVVVIDAALYDAIVNSQDESHFADFTVTTDDEGYIDEIEVNGRGTYNAAEASVAGEDMYAYVGVESASDRPLVPEDWIRIPFRPKMKSTGIESEFSGGSSSGEIVNGGNSLGIDDNGNTIFYGNDEGMGIDRGLIWDYGDYNDGVNSRIRQDNYGLTVGSFTENGGGGSTGEDEEGYSSSVRIVTNQDANEKVWQFDGAGALTFPDGSVQTTAYTGSEVTTGGDPLFIVVNQSGESAYSNDGETWTQVASFPDGEGSLGLDRVAVHRDFIVYIDGDDNLWTAEEPGVQPTLITITSEAEGSYNWNDVQVGGNYVVAVGSFNPAVGNDVPAFAYTTNGSSWTVGSVDPEYIAFTGAIEFTSVDYDGTGWFITASDDQSETAGHGAFYTTNLSIELSEPQFITFTGLDTPPSIDRVIWTGSKWFVLDADLSIVGQRIYVSSGANPLSSTWTQYSLSSIADDYDYRLGMSDNGFYESAGGNGTFMIASGEGQILYTTNGGTIWSGLVPNAYTCTIDSVLAGGSTVITGFTMTLGGTDWDGNNFNGIEKLTITGATPSDYNGTRYVKTFGIPDSNLSRPSNTRNTNWIPGTYTVVVGEDFTLELVVDAEFYLTGSNITITGSGLYGWGHEFTISGTELGGTDVIDDIILTAYSFATAGKEYRVFTDSECTTALDSSGFATFEGASAILNRGTYIDAVGYGLNKFLIGNDDEQLLTAPHDDLSVWTIVDNQNNDFEYWDDIGFNADFGDTGAVAGSYLTNGSATLVLNSDGSITFPDGSVQTTAYTGTLIGPMYVVANVDGNITYSRDGTTFSATFDTGLNQIGTVAVGPNKIVYSGHDINVDADTAGLYSTSSPTTQPTLITGTDGSGSYFLTQVQYFPTATPPWVAVGLSTQTSPREPIILHSTDAVTWNETRVNATDLSTFFTDDAVDLRFTDIHYAQGGWLISADRNTNSGAKGGGLWWTTDITQELTTSSNFISADANFKAIEYFDSPNLGDRWFAITNDSFWGTSDTIPSTAVNWGEWDPALFTEIILNNTNLNGLTVEEATSGVTTYDDGGEFGILDIWALSSGAGHIVFWTDVPDGPWVSIPAPYTATIDTWSSSSTSAITYTGTSFRAQGEKFTVTGSSVTDYNGTFYIGDGGSVYTDAALTIPFATDGFSSFTGTATLTWSHGEYIDALGFAGGYIYCANDDEQVYRGELTNYNTITWTKVDDKNNSLEYWNDIGYYSEFQGSSGSTADTGNITFNGNQIRGTRTADYFGLIELVPNTETTGEFSNVNFLDEGQFIRIYPTNEFDSPHIHIAAGTGSNDTGSLFLGDDDKFVNVDNYGVIRIRAYDPDGPTSANWSFNANGYFTVPPGGDIIEDMSGDSLVNGVRRHSLDTGAGTITLAAEHNGKSILFNGTGGNSDIVVPSNSTATLPIGYTVTIIMDDFDSNTVWVYGDEAGEAIINAVGQAPTNDTGNQWVLGNSGNVGIYTIMKVNTNRWILSGPDINLD